jgi:hypothetical protein
MKASSRSRLAAAWDFAAKTSTSLLVLFAAANGLAALLLAAGVGERPPGALQHGIERLRPVYPELADEEIRQLLEEFWRRPYVYEPYTQFREDAYQGRYLNLQPEGFRSPGHAQPWPPDPGRRNIFVFGGSTAMGYGLADAETLPARLEAALADLSCGVPVAVYNFARSNYFSTQERILFEQLVTQGALPTVAVFFDGLNDFAYARDEPKFTTRLSYLMRETPTQTARRWVVSLPLARLLKGLRSGTEEGATVAPENDQVAAIVERWLRNKRLIEAVAREFDVATLFVWQPVSLYRYDRDRSPFELETPATPPGEASLVSGYASLEELWRAGDPRLSAPGFLWLADAHPPGRDSLYVDRVHYSAAFTTTLAQAIAPVLDARLCEDRRGPAEPASGKP